MVQHRWEAVGLPDQSRRGRRFWYLIRSLYYTMAVTMLAGCGFTDLVGPHDEDDKDSDPVSVVTERLPVARVGVEYEKQLSAEGGQGGYTWSIVEGAAPEGMELTDRGVIHGTPVNLGDAMFTVRAESEDGLTADRSFTLSVEEAPSPVTVVTEELPDATRGEPYRAALAADGGDGTWTWFVLDGGLPEGLSLSDGGVIEGTPTAGGEFTFLVKARAGTGQYGTRELTLRVVDDPVVVTTETLPSGTLGVPYQAQLEAEGAGGAYDWAIVEGALPAGLSLNGDGVIQGLPSQSGESDFWVRATASDGQADERRLEISITALPVVINAASLPLGQVGVDYDVALTAQGGDGAFVWSLSEGSLPVGSRSPMTASSRVFPSRRRRASSPSGSRAETARSRNGSSRSRSRSWA